MNSPPEASALAHLQDRFAAALRQAGPESEEAVGQLAECRVDDGLEPAQGCRCIATTRGRCSKARSSERIPCCGARSANSNSPRWRRGYRAEHPSRSGDLHWVGEEFASWLAPRVAGEGRAWLADLARLEWACEEAMVAARLPPLAAAELARVAPEAMAEVGLALQPCVRTFSSPVHRVVCVACRSGRWCRRACRSRTGRATRRRDLL